MTQATVVLDVLSLTVWAAVGIFLAVTIALVLILLIAKKYLVSSGKVKITINSDTEIEVESGASILSSLAAENVFLSSACGGKGSCGQCRVQAYRDRAFQP